MPQFLRFLFSHINKFVLCYSHTQPIPVRCNFCPVLSMTRCSNRNSLFCSPQLFCSFRCCFQKWASFIHFRNVNFPTAYEINVSIVPITSDVNSHTTPITSEWKFQYSMHFGWKSSIVPRTFALYLFPQPHILHSSIYSWTAISLCIFMPAAFVQSPSHRACSCPHISLRFPSPRNFIKSLSSSFLPLPFHISYHRLNITINIWIP